MVNWPWAIKTFKLWNACKHKFTWVDESLEGRGMGTNIGIGNGTGHGTGLENIWTGTGT